MNIFNQNTETLKSSNVYIGFLILKEIEKSKERKVTMYKLTDVLKKEGLTHSRHLTLGLTFLYSLGIIKFEEPYVWIES
jgi:hypothetical protein